TRILNTFVIAGTPDPDSLTSLHRRGCSQHVEVLVVLELRKIGIAPGISIFAANGEPATKTVSKLEIDGLRVVRAIKPLIFVLDVTESDAAVEERAPGMVPGHAAHAGQEESSETRRFRRLLGCKEI